MQSNHYVGRNLDMSMYAPIARKLFHWSHSDPQQITFPKSKRKMELGIYITKSDTDANYANLRDKGAQGIVRIALSQGER